MTRNERYAMNLVLTILLTIKNPRSFIHRVDVDLRGPARWMRVKSGVVGENLYCLYSMN